MSFSYIRFKLSATNVYSCGFIDIPCSGMNGNQATWQSFCNTSSKRTAMNIKRTFGVILTVLGIAGLIYTAILFLDAKGTENQVKTLIVWGVLGSIFFFTGIGLVKNTNDDARPPMQ